ncbi:MAG: GAF domain-containing protein [Armatimonadota bacterium]|nr:GAF domain-containing protein [Armatimonadota bacterium]
MRRRFWERLARDPAVSQWATIAISSGLLVTALTVSAWPPFLLAGLLCLAATVAAAVSLPQAPAGDHTVLSAVVGAGLSVAGAPATALAAATGALVGGFLHRRPAARVGQRAGHYVLAALAAGIAGQAATPGPAPWYAPLLGGAFDAPHGLALLAAAVVYVAAMELLSGWRAILGLRAPFLGGVGAAIAFDTTTTVVLFGIGALVGLVATSGLPSVALFALVPMGAIEWAALVYVRHRAVAAEAETLQAAAAELSRSASEVEVLQVVAAAIDRHVPADLFVVCLRLPGDREPRVVHYRGPGGEEVIRQVGLEHLVAQAVRAGRPIRIDDYDRHPQRTPRLDVLFGRGAIRSVLIVPLLAGTEVSGAVLLARGSPAPFSARSERFATTIADQAGMALRTVYLAEHARRQTDRLTALQHAGLLAGVGLDPAEVCQTLVERVVEVTAARYGYLALLDSHSRDLSVEAASGVDREAFAHLRARLDGEVTALHEAVRALRQRRTIVCDEAQIGASPCPVIRALRDARGALATPLVRQGRPVGAVVVVRTDPRPFGDADATVLEAMAAQGIMLLERARTQVALEARLRHLEAAVALSRRLGTATDLRTAFTLIADGVRTILGIDRCLLLVWEGRDGAPEILTAGLSDEFAAAVRVQFPTVGRYLVQAAHPIVVHSFATDLRMAPLREAVVRERLRSGILFPMRSQGESVGALLLLDPDVGERTDEDLRLAGAFVDQAALTVRTVVLQARADRRRQELALLQHIVGVAGGSLELAAVYRTTAAELAEAFGIPRVCIYRLEGTWLRLAAQVGAPDAPRELPETAGIMGRAARAARPEFVPNVRDDPDYIASSFDVTSAAAVPILYEGTATAVLKVEGTASRPITPQIVEFLGELAPQLGGIVRNAMFYEEQRRGHDELQVLYEAARATSGTLDLHTVLDSLIAVTCRAFGYETGTVCLIDPDSGDLVVEAVYGYPEPVTGRRLPAGVGIVGWVARMGTPLVVDDVLSDARYVRRDERTRSELAVPLIAEGKVLGVINVESTRLAAFGQRDLRLLTTLASYAVMAIQNARLYEQASRLAITDGLTELYNHRYLHDTLERIVERARREGQPIGLIMLEIDHFKRYNDTYGHRSGDEALRTVAALLRRGSRPSDIVARYGGDEFMVILPGAGKAAVQETAERLRRAVEAYPLVLANGTITTVTLSVGVAAYPQDGQTVDALVEAVDRAQYLAKRSGGNKVHVAHAP